MGDCWVLWNHNFYQAVATLVLVSYPLKNSEVIYTGSYFFMLHYISAPLQSYRKYCAFKSATQFSNFTAYKQPAITLIHLKLIYLVFNNTSWVFYIILYSYMFFI